MADAQHKAEIQAISAGASKTDISVTDVEEVPLSYYPGEANRVKVKVVGSLSE